MRLNPSAALGKKKNIVAAAVAAPNEEVIPHASSVSSLAAHQRKRRNSKVIATAFPNNKLNMAVTYHNPQDPETCSAITSSSPEHQAPKKKKPSRALLYVRNRVRGTATNLSVLVIAVVLITLSVHRVIALWATHRRWINAPITYMHRQCPAFDYEPFSSITAAKAQEEDQQQVQEQPPQPKICLTTLTDQKSPSKFQRFMRWRNFDGVLDLTWANKQQYADKHGYHLYDGSQHIDSSRPPAWSKIKAVKHLMEQKEQRCDWIMWTDADTVIMNSSIQVTDFLPADPTKDLLVGSDKGGGYNSGVFLFRNSAWSRKILDQWWGMKDFVRPPGLSLSGDNSALKALLASMEDFDEHVLSPPRCTFNSFAKFLTLGQSLKIMDHLEDQEWYLDNEHYHKGDFIAHTPGVDNKSECLKLLLQEAR